MPDEIISDKNLKRARVAANSAATGVSKGHEEGFNEVELSTTSPNDAAPSTDPELVEPKVRPKN